MKIFFNNSFFEKICLTIVRYLIISGVMEQTLSLMAKILDKGNRFIIEQLQANGASGLVPSHGDILALLYMHESLTMKDIAKKIHKTKATLTVLVDKLEKMDFVKRETSARDSRYTYISLTQKGKDFQAVFDNISMDLNTMLHKNLTAEEISALTELLQKMNS